MRMMRLAAGLALCLGMAGCLSDQRWEGRADRCSGGVEWNLIMLLDWPVGPVVTGWWGIALNGRQDVFQMAPIESSTNMFGTLKFDSVFQSGNSTTRWKVELKHGPMGGDYEGDVEILGSSSTIRCDAKLSAE
ncbi:MAG: hypothetical protein HY904_24340 [Deltaproteobacteria bacterium]|nr:hypothetical protein [Deltaproteobacteria bacterium]